MGRSGIAPQLRVPPCESATLTDADARHTHDFSVPGMRLSSWQAALPSPRPRESCHAERTWRGPGASRAHADQAGSRSPGEGRGCGPTSAWDEAWGAPAQTRRAQGCCHCRGTGGAVAAPALPGPRLQQRCPDHQNFLFLPGGDRSSHAFQQPRQVPRFHIPALLLKISGLASSARPAWRRPDAGKDKGLVQQAPGFL